MRCMNLTRSKTIGRNKNRMKRVRVECFKVHRCIEVLPCICIWKWDKLGFFWLKWGVSIELLEEKH